MGIPSNGLLLLVELKLGPNRGNESHIWVIHSIACRDLGDWDTTLIGPVPWSRIEMFGQSRTEIDQ
jgi:hypothetical protein